ncbi:MAG: Glu-tRNA(Gln) amidotransferase subunit GatD [Candidatus Pacearchaeota archaeon]
MLKEKIISPGDYVIFKCKDKEWEGTVLESYNPEVILLKIPSGYNIGLKEDEIIDVKVLKNNEKREKEKVTPQKKENLPNIALIITGGTISSRLDPKTGGVIPTDEEEILKVCPEIKNICNITIIEKPFLKFSEDMSLLDWKNIALTCEKYLNDENIAGVVVTHGTDFLHYGGAALSFMLGKLNKPVAITYSQRSIDRASTDAHLNLLCAAKYVTSDIAELAIVGHKDLNDEVCLAMPSTRVRKMHSTRRDTFKIINSSPIAEISKEDFRILREFNARDNSRKIKANTNYSDKVALIKIYPGQDPDILEYYLSKGFKGIILELTGLGHVPSKNAKYNWLPSIKKAVDRGLLIFGCAQTIYGSLNLNVYSNGRELLKTGLVPLKDMLSETAFVKLSWLLGQKSFSNNKELIKEKMLENFCGEISDSIGFNF